MCDLGINADNFNPRVLYVLKGNFNNQSKKTYHSHDFVEIKYILSGSCNYRIENDIYTVKSGDTIICNPWASHEKILSDTDDLVEFDIGVDNIFVKTLPSGCLIENGASPVINLRKYSSEFFKCCSEMLLEHDSHEPGRELLLKSLVMKLIVLILKATYYRAESFDEKNGLSFESSDKANIVNTIVDYINQNYMKEISLDKISKNMYLSPAYISKVFKEETFESPINYLIKKRLSIAEELLKDASQSIKSIAKSVGYDDVYHFSKLFKKYYNCSPSKYRDEIHVT